MDFGKVLSTLSERFEAAEIDWAVVGGLALALYGLPRTTLDVDVMVDGDRQETVLSVLDGLGFDCLHASLGYSNHRHREVSWGQVDVLYVRGDTKRRILSSPRQMPGPGGQQVPVADAEFVIAMKVFAIQQNPDRRKQDLADIRKLAAAASVSDESVKSTFLRYSADDLWEEYQG